MSREYICTDVMVLLLYVCSRGAREMKRRVDSGKNQYAPLTVRTRYWHSRTVAEGHNRAQRCVRLQ